jgi:hypothetical protein
LQTVRAVVSRDPHTCWRAFVDPATLGAWVPGLRKARVISLDAAGLPLEILFEFGPSLTYSLVYTYDALAHEVKWEPRTGKHDAVAGFVRFDAFDDGTRITYGLEHGDGRSPAETALGDITALVASFVRWVGR